MDYSLDPATSDTAVDSVTFGDLCYAIEKGRVSTERRGASYELRLHDVRRWRRQEESLRIMLAPLADSLALDLGGL
ncbi:MAG TPA: hypothetical protein VFN78_03085 [Ktedonobacterales bacterium]|nr:hypothetical protein [Ktedonobacterales bacterium]